MSKLEKLFNAMNLHIENNKTVTKFKDGVKSVIQCNNKPIKTEISPIEQFSSRNRENIIFSPQSKTKDCSYLFLEEQIHDTLSSKINFIVSTLLEFAHNPELYNKIKSQEFKQLLLKFIKDDIIDFNATGENSLLSKWIKINEKISEKSLQDGLISLTHKIDDAYVEDVQKIEYYKNYHRIPEDERYTFVLFESYISVEFPIYNKLKETKPKLLGVEINKNEIEVIKAIYQYIFKNIDKKNAYSLLNNSLLKDKRNKENEKLYLVNQLEDIATPTMLLIKTFDSVATHLDGILDSMVDINESLVKNAKFNLNLTKDEINELKSHNEFMANYSYDSVKDLKNEIDSNPRIKFDEFEKKLNEVPQKSSQNVKTNQPRIPKSKNYKNSSIATMPSFSSTSIFGMARIESNSNILDSTDKSFETKIPNEARKRHTYILAGSGSGKTSLIETFLYEDCQRLDQSTIIFDLMGKATKSVLKFVDNPNRVIIIDPYFHPSITPVINPFEFLNEDGTVKEKPNEIEIENRTNAIINAFDIALKLKDGWSVNQKAVLAPCISTLLRKGNSDIFELQKMMNDDINQDLVKLGKKSPSRGHRDFFKQEFNNESYEVTKRAISAKLQVFLNDSTFVNIVTGQSTINIRKEVNTKGKIIIFKLPSKQKLFARLMMEIIQDIMRERINIQEDEIVPTHVYLDEFQHYLTPTIEEVSTESRNYKFYATFAHQSFVQLSKKMQGIVLSNSNIKIVGQCSYDNGKKMAKEMKADFETIEALNQGEFMFKIGSKDVIKLKNTDKFINDTTPYHNKQRTKHMKHQFKKYYVYKNVPLQDYDNNEQSVLNPKHEDF
ncbi:type IV secretion system DNA-binding domain-containing protein [Malaciobacter mytili]|uniref:type IV secretory system conjugative DNA transfer family protein n=1 Tax=Malaciobacter mytili TaxID=603050 RepID=UPI003BB1E643